MKKETQSVIQLVTLAHISLNDIQVLRQLLGLPRLGNADMLITERDTFVAYLNKDPYRQDTFFASPEIWEGKPSNALITIFREYLNHP